MLGALKRTALHVHLEEITLSVGSDRGLPRASHARCIYIYIYIRHRASGTMWSVHRALTCRLLFSCPAEHLIRETPLPVLLFSDGPHARSDFNMRGLV